MARFFIDRPIFAWVLAIIVMLAGILSIATLPIAQYPSIAPPAVAITANYPGASAQTLEDTVTQVIEQKMKGLDNLSYMASTSESSGAVTITLTFENGTDPDTAQVQVQNKLSLATALLPQEVQQQGVTVTKSATNFLNVLAFTSEDGSMSDSDLSDYVAANVQETISRVQGVGDTTLFGSQYSMRIWLDPDKLNNFNLTPVDVRAAIQAQNAQVSAGQLGALPAVANQQLNATITAQTRLKTAEEFENILLRTRTDGSQVRLRDVARIELGSESYNTVGRYNGKPAAGLAIKLATGANALDTVRAIDKSLEEQEKFFPPGMKVQKPYDTTPFVRISIEQVVHTLVEAVVLVFLVMYLFLQNFRATLIPTIAVPVVLLGTFGVLAVFGFTINTLTMFAMVLAIGLLVDDAIVVVENVERVMAEEQLSPKEATRKSMDQITGALVGVALVLAAVFVPMAFFGGSTGVIYRQFSITIVSAMTLSVLVAMVLTPALCATLLKPGHGMATTGFFGWFNRVFDRSNGRYQGVVRHMLGKGWRYMIAYVVIVALVVVGFMKTPAGFLPDEDQGTLFVLVQLPPGATDARTGAVLKQVEHHFLVDQKDSVAGIFAVSGFSFAGTGQNVGFAFVKLRPWDERTGKGQSVTDVAAKAGAFFATLRDAQVFAVAPPAVSELGNATGFDLMLQDRANLGHAALMQARNQLLAELSQDKRLVAVRPNGQEDMPEFKLEIDPHKAEAMGVSIADINNTFSSAWGSTYVNDFIDKGRVKKVMLQADAPYRMNPQDIDRWFVRNSAGTMVPFNAFATARWTQGSPRLERYNSLPSVEILGMALPGAASSGQAMQIVEAAATKLPAGIGFEWTGLSRQEKASTGQTGLLYGLSILIVFLCLAALYESWSIPFSVILVVPLGVFGTLVAAVLTWKMNDVYFQVGLLTTIGLASKNAILIVEFAKELHEGGKSLVAAALEAARMRLRPILMTSLAFILGVVPLVLTSGAGAGAQHALGTAVIGGMISGTVLAIFFVPLFFVLVRGLFERRAQPDASVPQHAGH
ncbi:efflux RND transporter permease subunit [Xanthomonas campestris]|uniref:efflux RND transporter permease subunit n=1 Tax=Xanthomonas campestris TaxID=339 RepID=UPI002B22E509|nr:efflux RND transporter permease subunit [Xanthomonas campestris]MEA9763222.1 efflux RND transporter permease subunit [Xanthomonas campestris pv. raphani]MEA9815420.1 efflux RND transporter permease subunit [Xanthomonas campestris pv. raphani]MEA9908688.1 efflux RND transporter permease subunit [Xanthomonas campestris pv. raphani]MEA9924807.1 efflux RND transporter permease subunit [Xanthomonas campestris pv. raphani]MEA9936697.1 efflux RND transporter permease subunit [Xanthomonas campestri